MGGDRRGPCSDAGRVEADARRVGGDRHVGGNADRGAAAAGESHHEATRGCGKRRRHGHRQRVANAHRRVGGRKREHRRGRADIDDALRDYVGNTRQGPRDVRADVARRNQDAVQRVAGRSEPRARRRRREVDRDRRTLVVEQRDVVQRRRRAGYRHAGAVLHLDVVELRRARDGSGAELQLAPVSRRGHRIGIGNVAERRDDDRRRRGSHGRKRAVVDDEVRSRIHVDGHAGIDRQRCASADRHVGRHRVRCAGRRPGRIDVDRAADVRPRQRRSACGREQQDSDERARVHHQPAPHGRVSGLPALAAMLCCSRRYCW